MLDPNILIEGGRNTIVYESDEQSAEAVIPTVFDQPLTGIECRMPAGLRNSPVDPC
jgi:hypothetical protein